ncbi:superoxide dismutase family protein [Cellulomonas dongxiuzhuiae]|uniref:Superoxide dismutase [Cu-Zn] n=1 Tax=Cellulomonas dongxiuzhuiae TaxID=2819979 RepID=A0ABX8GJN4_9CELL|nr:superoxide dismutase family protein [Cellulomonas dongxiuzhuiae]MBO3094818.1 superoxide dismutase family protein [Cellulomonas dongxiuzhuiae]QWC15851.1 superoxide dismutase family protein [Cellulomonas dongxiuzhuiae]
MRGTLRAATVAVAAAAALAACSASGEEQDDPVMNQQEATTPAMTDEDDDGTEVMLVDPDGGEVGTVWLDDDDGALEIEVAAGDLPPGFHGFHLHTIGVCEPDSPDPTDPAKVGDFLSAGGHLGADVADHAAHQGDLPSLLVDSTGAGRLTASTDAVTLEELMDDDGTAVMVHAGPDNFANIPERYAPNGPDADTLKTGDSGDRIACGVVGG